MVSTLRSARSRVVHHPLVTDTQNHRIASIHTIDNHGILRAPLPAPKVRRRGQLNLKSAVLLSPSAVVHPIAPIVFKHIRSPHHRLPLSSVEAEHWPLLGPGPQKIRSRGMSKKPLLLRRTRLPMRDAEEMPKAVSPLNEGVVVDIPPLVLANGGIIDLLKIRNSNLLANFILLSSLRRSILPRKQAG